ncbi:MAG: hypothetical protein ABL927_11835 [Bdellovibrionales bacterium]
MSKKNIDALKMKESIQKMITQETEGLSFDEEVAYYEKGIQTSDLADWFNKIKSKKKSKKKYGTAG